MDAEAKESLGVAVAVVTMVIASLAAMTSAKEAEVAAEAPRPSK